MSSSDRREFRRILDAHAQTVAIGEACARTMRDPAADLRCTIDEAERTLADLAGVREEIERVMAVTRMA